MFSLERMARLVLCATLALLFLMQGCSATCNSGVLQMKPFPSTAYYDDCFASAYVSSNGVKSLCTIAYKAAVNGSGVVRLVPLSTATFNYSYPGPSQEQIPLPCKDVNASGLLNAGSSTAATVTMFDELGGPISNLTKTGSDQITLFIAHSDGYRGPGPVCSYNFTVVSGCFLGVKAPSAPPACPAKYYVATGLAGAKYCAPCPPGTTSAGPNSKSCSPCPAGWSNYNYAGTCQTCQPGYSSAKVGAKECDWCSMYDNKWTDGKTCAKCPAGSFVSTTNQSQCHKCKAGVKCCTVNPSKDCPACPKGWTPGPSATSVFALNSGSTPACLTSKYALCAPKFNVTINETCLLAIKPMPLVSPDEQYCDWAAAIGIKGMSPNPKADLFNLSDWSYYDSAVIAGNVTNVAAPYLDFTVSLTNSDNIVTSKCILRYRALTSPAARLLGAAPKPCPTGKPGCASSAGTCPAGQYLETKTDTKPAPCLPCPPGTYNKVPSSKACTPCPLGQFATGYGNKACKSCPLSAPLTPKKGAASCQPCGGSAVRVGVNKCQACPQYSDKFTSSADACLSNQYGSICCAFGNCKGLPACPSKLQPVDSVPGAVLQVVSKNLNQPQCQKAIPLTCLDINGMMQLSSPFQIGFQLDPIQQPRCLRNGGSYMYLANLYGTFSGPKRGASTYYDYNPSTGVSTVTGYELIADATKGTVTIGVSKSADPTITTNVNLTECTVTFKLIAGYAFDLAPPAGSKCPTNAVSVKLGGRSFCNFCNTAQYKKASTGKCVDCPAGSYQDQAGSTGCKSCPAGTSCSSGYSSPSQCQAGAYSAKAGSTVCKECPANTYSNVSAGATSCTACPKFTIAPKASSACSVPFLK